MTEFFIPTNFEESGKLLGVFNMRNVIEAGVLSLPFIYLIFKIVPLGLTWKIIIASVFVIPIGGFALIGINDDSFTVFIRSFWRWLKNRKIIEYRGEAR